MRYLQTTSCFFILTFLLFAFHMHGQKFTGSAVFGANLAQIDGDFLYGFNKTGITGGAKLGYGIDKNKYINLEFLYSERGSAVKLFETNPANRYTLRYLEIPVIFSIHDWYQEKKNYHVVRADFGFSYGALFQLEIPPVVNEEDFRSHDVSFILGAAIQFTKNIGLSVRYTRSLFDMLQTTLDDGREIKFRGYFITTRMEYRF